MISPEILAIVMFVTTLGLLLFGFPVAFTLAGTALMFGFLGDALEIFNFRMLGFFPQRIFGTMINEPLVAVPLFIFMGIMLEKTKIAAGLLQSIGELFGSTKGGLGIGVVIVGMLLAASTGIVGATVVTMGMLSLPSMMKAGYDQKIAKYGHLANTSGFQLIPAVFSHTGQIHTAFKDLIREQIRQKIVAFENQAKPSKIKSVFKWWSKCISMVIAKTASRNVIYKANKLGESMFVRQSEMLIPEEELGSQSPVSYEEDFEDLSSNVDLYVFNDQMVQGYRGVNINSRHNEESLGEIYRKDDIDVSNQEHTAPVYFQSLSLD